MLEDAHDSGEVTLLLSALRRGERGALDRLMPLVYDGLHRIAHRQLRRRGGVSLNTTALLHEAYLKLADGHPALRDRNHFMALAAVTMRNILVDAVRKRQAQKRGGGEDITLIDNVDLGVDARSDDILALHEALNELGELNPRLVTLVELRFFGGLTVEEAADVLVTSPRTVKRDWQKARAFLHRSLATADPATA
ncbi:MAG: ECF-type sigma factor [Acidobacteriota bacterium]